MSDPRYIAGIDLGTTHCVVAYTEAAATRETDEPEIRIFPIRQVVNPGEVKPRELLPSFVYLPGPFDIQAGSIALPWDQDVKYVVGEFARKRGSEIPNRLISSAKSWLCHGGVDRTAPILPWDSPSEAERMSPVDACATFLRHIRDAWNSDAAFQDAGAQLHLQDVFLTVPASFDAVARELTVKAAQAAGIDNLTLLEEPQAAFYSWIYNEKARWRKQVHVGETILVCDIGGGTTDFSLIQVSEEAGELTLRRVAVGDHILLGGDNMDLALAHSVRARLAAGGARLDSRQFRGLWYACRTAKEDLLAHPEREAEPLVILGSGSSLIGGTLRTELTRREVEQVLVDGFFPMCEKTEFPGEQPKVGIREMGLPYETDPAITRHLARFLSRQAQEASEGDNPGVPYPSAVLFNGGVMKSQLLRKRVIDVLKNWQGKTEIRELHSVDLDLAVACGAAGYGMARRGRGIRIRGGTARSYYIGIESVMPAVPGIPAPMKALCVVPFGMEEGTESEIRQREFGLVVGEPAVFHLFASTTRKNDRIGEVIEDWLDEIEEVTTMEAVLPVTDAREGALIVPVWLQSSVTEVGTLELWCVSRDEDRRWKLEFNLREREDT